MSETKAILIVEDQFLIAINLKTEFESNGWKVIGPCPNVEEALQYLESETIDAACLDYSLESGTSEPVAHSLVDKKIPFMFLTGDSLKLKSLDFAKDKVIVNKPLDMDTLIKTAEGLIN